MKRRSMLKSMGAVSLGMVTPSFAKVTIAIVLLLTQFVLFSQKETRPNVLLIAVDDLNDWIGLDVWMGIRIQRHLILTDWQVEAFCLPMHTVRAPCVIHHASALCGVNDPRQRVSLFSTIKIMLINFTKKQEEN